MRVSSFKILLLFMFLGSAVGFSQLQTRDNVRVAIKSGNVTTLSNYFSSSVDLKVGDNEGVYSSRQASLVLQRFFVQKPAQDFKYNHNGSTANNSKYYSIGTYKSGSSSYRVLISYKVVNNKYLIDKIHFDLE